MSDATYTIQSIADEDKEDVIEFLKRTFFKQEPLNKALHLVTDDDDSNEDLENMIIACLKLPFCFKAIDKNNSIVGVCLCSVSDNIKNRDLIKERQNDIKTCTSAKFVKILHIFEANERKADFKNKFPEVDTILKIDFTATDPEWRRKGIMKNLLEAAEKEAKKHGITHARLDTSNEYSQRAGLSMGYTCISKLLFEDVKVNGEPIVMTEPPHLYDNINVKKLT